MRYSYYSGFPRYVSVGEKRAKAERKLDQLKKKRPDIEPLILSGYQIANTWWGRAWNKNLEKYADYSNRIGRGRSYIRNGFVLDFKINSGEVTSLVQGTRPNPYKVAIKIKPLNKKAWNEIKQECEGKIESLQELIEGRVPEELTAIFTATGKGLFPSPKEIEFDCSCPDWASMCKHVAATLYGVAVKLDQDPKLFFLLRNAEMGDLITKAVQDKSRKMLEKAKKKTSRVLDNVDASRMFGIEIEERRSKTPKNKPKIKSKKKS